ncbi:hypothetical protein MTO96_035195 [Rhipicephalus appendiculatus]
MLSLARVGLAMGLGLRRSPPTRLLLSLDQRAAASPLQPRRRLLCRNVNSTFLLCQDSKARRGEFRSCLRRELGGTAARLQHENHQASISVATALPTGAHTVKVIFNDHQACELNYIWLRDNCSCPECVHPKSKQKLVDTAGLDYNVRPVSMEVSADGSLEVTWGDSTGTHQSSYSPLWSVPVFALNCMMWP